MHNYYNCNIKNHESSWFPQGSNFIYSIEMYVMYFNFDNFPFLFQNLKGCLLFYFPSNTKLISQSLISNILISRIRWNFSNFHRWSMYPNTPVKWIGDRSFWWSTDEWFWMRFGCDCSHLFTIVLLEVFSRPHCPLLVCQSPVKYPELWWICFWIPKYNCKV